MKMPKQMLDDNNIILGNGILNSEISSFFNNKDYFLCLDNTVFRLHYDYLKKLIDNAKGYLVIEADEANKDQEHVSLIHEMLFEHKADRHSTLICLGGGLIGDLGGYAAATYMRGINLIQIPTTLLACVDSCLGGKVAINQFGIKNIIGTFFQPKKVIVDPIFLTTLTTRLFKEGLVELIKHGLLQDKTILAKLAEIANIEDLRDNEILLLELIEQSMIVKLNVIEQDLYDNNYRQQLNLGHSVAHCLELDANNDYLHGECVAIGILLSLTLEDNYLENRAFVEAKKLFEKFECHKELVKIDFTKLNYDKKKQTTMITEVILNDIGKVEFKKYEIAKLQEIYENNYVELKKKVKTSATCFVFKPTTLKGEVCLPPSKSYLHRYLIGAALSKKLVKLTNVTSLCDDVKVTIAALEKYNVSIKYENDCLFVDGRNFVKQDKVKLDLNESASSLRILLPLLIQHTNELELDGKPSLARRSLATYFELFKENEINYHLESELNLPLTIKGNFNNNVYEITDLTSSQFISGLLFMLPLLDIDTTIKLKKTPPSLPYLKMTLKVLADFKVKVDYNEDYTFFTIKRKQSYLANDNYEIEIDYSAYNFMRIANELGNEIILPETRKTEQNDAYLIDYLTKSNVLDLTNLPDCLPIASLYLIKNGGQFTNIERLKDKESNRIEATTAILEQMKISYELTNSCLKVNKGELSGGAFETYNDHRLAMTLIIASTKANGNVLIKEIKSINKSFPTFIDEYLKLGGIYDEK